MLGNYLNMSILREHNYHSSNSSKQVGNSAYFTGSAFPLGNLLAGNYRVLPSIRFVAGTGGGWGASILEPSRAMERCVLGCTSLQTGDQAGQRGVMGSLGSDALTPKRGLLWVQGRCGAEEPHPVLSLGSAPTVVSPRVARCSSASQSNLPRASLAAAPWEESEKNCG